MEKLANEFYLIDETVTPVEETEASESEITE